MNTLRKSPSSTIGVRLAVVTLLLWQCAVSRAWADDPAPAVQGKQLTSETLGEMLQNMGYEVKAIKLEGGQVLQSVKISHDGWNFTFELSISFDNNYVWLLAPLGTAESGDKIPHAIAVKLLEENFKIQPMTFTYVPNAKKLDLIRTLDNKDVTPAKVRIALEMMMGTIQRTEPLWNPAKWETGEKTAAGP